MQFSTKILILAFLMVFSGAAFPFLMVSKVIEPTFWLSFLSYAGSVGGVLLGMYGVAARLTEDKQDEWEDWRGL